MSYLEHFSADRADRIYVEVLNQIQVNKLYLQPGITARQVAEMIGVDHRAISAAISLQSGENFLSLLSRLRIREACRLLKDPKYNEWSAETIGLRSGFSSRQAFYLAFNRAMGMTPNQYREQEAQA